MMSQQQKPATPWPLIVLFIVLSAGAVTIGIVFYFSQKRHLLTDTVQELSTISDMKVKQISQWRLERIGDGIFLSNNALIIKQFSEFMSESENVSLRNDILSTLMALNKGYDYRTLLVLDRNLDVKVFYPKQDTIIGDYLKPQLPAILKNGKVVLTDLHSTGNVSFIHLDLVVPLKDHEAGDTSVSGLVVMRIDPREVLWPLVQSWPVVSKTAETLIFHREGDEIVYLNELRHIKKSELILRKPVSEKKLPAVMALEGIGETTDAVDYRGEPVIAVMKKIPDSPWFMVAKVDRAEVFKTLNSRVLLILALTTLFILTAGSFLGFLWWDQRVRFYRSKYETELDRLALISHFDYILKYANDIILLIDKDFRIVEANDRALEAYQYSRRELVGMEIRKLRSDETRHMLEEDVRVIDEKGFSIFETIHRRKDGTLFPIEISARKINIEGSVYYNSISRDISDRKLAEETLRESETRFRKIFEEGPLGILMSDKDFSILRVNTSLCHMLGYSETELIGLTFRDFTHPEHISGDEISLIRLIAGEIPLYHTEKRYLRKDRSIIWGSATISVIRNNKGEAQFFLAMVEDITSKKQAEDNLLSAKEKAEESDRLKTAFLHNISHEIRTPMNAILGFTSLLNEPGLSEADKKQFIEIIFQSGTQLLSIINDIVDFAGIESGQVRLNISEININSTLRGLYEQFSYKGKTQHVIFDFQAPLPDEEVNIKTDGTKFIQVFSNLINNAFKFTQSGRIDFGYQGKGECLEFYVKDTGIGISPEHQSRIFERFYQVDSTPARKYTGTGLGLSICKAYIELLGGKIWIDSEKGKGASFYFTLLIKK